MPTRPRRQGADNQVVDKPPVRNRKHQRPGPASNPVRLISLATVVAFALTGLTGCKLFDDSTLVSRAEYFARHQQYKAADQLYRFILNRQGAHVSLSVIEGLADACDKQGKYSEAEMLYKQSLQRQQDAGVFPVKTLRRLSKFYLDQGSYGDAIPGLRTLVQIDKLDLQQGPGRQLQSNKTVRLISDLSDLAAAYRNAGHLAEAEHAYRWLTSLLYHSKRQSIEYAAAQASFADVLRGVHRPDEAVLAFGYATEALSSLAANDVHNLKSMQNIVEADLDLGCLQAAHAAAMDYLSANRGRDLSGAERWLIVETERLVNEGAKGDPYEPDYTDTANFHSWPPEKMPLRVSIVEEPEVAAYRKSFKRAIPECLNKWCSASGGRVSFKIVDSIADSDIVCILTARPAADALHEAGLTSSQCTKDVMKLAVVKIYAKPAKTYAYLLGVCLHELGHALGITGHSCNADDVMYFFGSGKSCVLSQRDKATIAKLYARRLAGMITNSWNRAE